ncbi:hypothetical protein [Fowlpox virus]|nr:hypothetical protein [Fowlpox virus]
MDACQRSFSNKIIFSDDINSSSFSPMLIYSGVYDSYRFGYVDSLLATHIDIKMGKRRQFLCCKCTNIFKKERQFKVCLEIGYRDSQKCIKKGYIFITFLHLDALVHITALLPPFSNYMDAKVTNFNMCSPECDCFFINTKLNIAKYPQANELQYVFVSSIQ